MAGKLNRKEDINFRRMEPLKLTAAQIKGEIAAYRQRIENARQKLDDLQHRIMSRKKKRDQQRELNNEIRHVKQIITYAADAMALMEKD